MDKTRERDGGEELLFEEGDFWNKCNQKKGINKINLLTNFYHNRTMGMGKCLKLVGGEGLIKKNNADVTNGIPKLIYVGSLNQIG